MNHPTRTHLHRGALFLAVVTWAEAVNLVTDVAINAPQTTTRTDLLRTGIAAAVTVVATATDFAVRRLSEVDLH
jgi:hypothetical protein